MMTIAGTIGMEVPVINSVDWSAPLRVDRLVECH
jgi:hypothetical protein